MPFRSKSQRRKFYAMANRGEVSKETVTHWEDATAGRKLPERIQKQQGFWSDMLKTNTHGQWELVKQFVSLVGMQNDWKPMVKVSDVPGGLAEGYTIKGIALKHGVPEHKIEKQLKMGTQVEMEHTNDPDNARDIAMDHLVEIPDYYDRLDEMEEKAHMEKTEDKTVSVFFVRHGSTKFNGDKQSPDRIRGWIDVPLDKDGHKDAKNAAKELKDKDVKVLYSSDLKRAHQTAEAIEDKLGLKMQVTFNLRPWNLGALQGEKTDDVLKEMNSYITERGKRKSPKDGEPFEDFLQRYFGKLSKILDEAKDTGKNIALVTHYRNLKAAEAWIAAGMKGTDVDVSIFKDDGPKTGGIMEWRWDGKKWHQK